MDTNLKKGKKIRAFCFRMFAAAALLTAIMAAIMGREAVVDLWSNGSGSGAVSGDFYDLPEFRQYITKLYHNAMIGFAGIGDDNGYPLTDKNAVTYAQKALEDFDAMMKKTGDDILYYMRKADGTEDGNVSYPIFSEYDGHLLLPENTRLCCYWDGANETLYCFENDYYDYAGTEYNPMYRYYTAQYKPNREEAADMQLVIAVSDKPTSGLLSGMNWKAFCYRYVMIFLSVSLILWMVFGVCSLFTGKAARQAKEDYAAISVKVYFEFKIAAVAAVIYLLYCTGLMDFGSYLTNRMPRYDTLWFYFPVGCLFYLLYTDIRQNKEKVLVSSFVAKCIFCIRDFWRGSSWYRRAMAANLCMLIAAIVLLAAGGYFFTLYRYGGFVDLHLRLLLKVLRVLSIVMLITGAALLLEFFQQSRLLKDMASVVNKLTEMKAGKGQEPLILSRHSMLGFAAKDLNELEKGIEKAVEQQNRSNRMKVELLTNVSHDLKTPLTSIINYADLLCEEELPENAAEYAKALQKKAYRLKNMVQDVFDLSKATSGNLVVEKAVIDLVKLIRQTLADMDERIAESDLTFKLNISREPLLIEADGEKLYRVFQNLFVNALQYSLENSRVHVQLLEEDGFAVAKVKNTSRQELDFDTAEIVERFVRADSSRTTEGSGLGLSIVQSFVEACGGQFKVETDADMFTASVRFPLTGKPIVVEPMEESEDMRSGMEGA